MLAAEQSIADKACKRINDEINNNIKMSEKRKLKKIKKIVREEANKTRIIKNENVIMATINDLMFRFIMLLPEGFEHLIYFSKIDEQKVKENIKKKRTEQNLTFTKVDLIKDVKTMEQTIMKINERIGNINDEKVLSSLDKITVAEMEKALKKFKGDELNLKMYENSTQKQEIEVMMKLLIVPIIIKNLLEKSNFDIFTTQLIGKLLEDLTEITKSWIKYINYQTKDSKEGKIRELLEMSGVLSNEEYEIKEKLYIEKTTVEIKKEIKNLKTKMTKQKNKNNKIESYLESIRENFKHTEEDITILKNSLEDMKNGLFEREMESLPDLLVYRDKEEIGREKREKDSGNKRDSKT